MNATVDPKSLTIEFERELAASREAVFDAWTTPDELSQWWDPTGVPLVACEMDVRPGGAFSFVNEGHGPPFAGTYVTVKRPSLLVFEALGSVGTVTLEKSGKGTRMHVSIRCSSKQHLEHFVKLGVAAGTDRTLDNLVSFFSPPKKKVTKDKTRAPREA
jgi:uncharacterized protein YndB with AHSA1/START domain